MTACGTVGLFAGVPSALGAPDGQRGMSAEHARVVEYWTPARRAAAIPRDLVIDERGQGYLRRPDGVLVPYGRQIADGTGAMTPNAKPGGGGGGGGSGDTTPPDISGMKPASGATIGASYTFEATVIDSQSSIRSVKFYVRKGSSRTQSFSASTSGNNVWTAGLGGFSDGSWSWYAVATDAAGNSGTSTTLSFTVDTSAGGGGGGGSGDTVTNAQWTATDAISNAAGRIYFEMPSNAQRTRWAGYVCSGTVVADAADNDRSIILTAAHCVYDDANKAFARRVMFIPDQDATTGTTGTDLNCANDPYGCWVPSFGVVDDDWTTRTFPDNVKWDYAYYVVKTSGAHSAGYTAGVKDALETAVGTLNLSFTAPQFNDGTAGKTTSDFTHALGYSYSDDPKFMYCAEDMTTQGTDNWWLPNCGLSGGSSGGPWMQGLNTSANDVVMSVNSWGYTNQPGMAGPKLSGTSASCVFADAQNTVYSNVLTTDGDAGVKSGCSL